MNYRQLIALSFSLLIVSTISRSQNKEPDSATAIAPAKIFIAPIPQIGALDRTLTSEHYIVDSIINFSNYRYAGDLLTQMPGIFIRDFSNLGMLPDVTMDGLGMREISFMADGIALNDPLTGLFNPYLYPAENIERIEIIQGTRSFLYGLNNTGGTVNFITKSKKAIKPYSKMRYSESGYGFGIIDGMVSQDIIRGLNVTAGLQHNVFGERYQNENYDCWNARIKARYNISRELNIFVSEMYNQSLTGLYGGVDIRKTADSVWYESMQATVRNSDAYEKINRHDVQFGAAARLLRDSASVTTATFFYISNVRRYRDLENHNPSNGIYLDQSFIAKWFGLKVSQNFSIGEQQFDLGAEIQPQRVTLTPASRESLATSMDLYAKTVLPVSSLLTIAAYGRFDNYKKQNLAGYGGDITLFPYANLKIFSGYSRSFRVPAFEELTGTPPYVFALTQNNEPERHHLFEIGLRWNHDDRISIGFRSFHRTIWNFITADTSSTGETNAVNVFARHQKKILRGFSGNGSIRFGSLYLEGTGQFFESIDHADNERTFPIWSANGGIYFWDKILNNHLDLKIGVNGKFFSSYTSREFNQQAEVFLLNGQEYKIQQTGVMDLVILAHIKSAYIHFIWDNLLNIKYVMNSFYPMPERQMRFGVCWEFLD